MIPVGFGPVAASVNLSTNKIYIANKNDASVSVIDGGTGAVVKTVTVGTSPTALLIDYIRNVIYVVNNRSGSVTVIDGTNDSVSGTVPTGNNPQSVAVNPATGLAYVANENSSSVTVLQGKQVKNNITGIFGVVAVTVNCVTNKIYAAGSLSSVTVIDGSSNTAVRTITGAGSNTTSGAVNPVTNRIYFTNKNTDQVTVIDGNGDTVTAIVSTGSGSGPAALAVNPVTNKVYVSDSGDSSVTVIDGATNTVSTISGGSGAVSTALALDVVTNRVYVANFFGDRVNVIDASNSNAIHTVSAGNTPLAVAVNTITNKVYTANFGDGTVTVIDGATYDIAPSTISSAPTRLVVEPSTNRIYGAFLGSQIIPIDGNTDVPGTPISPGFNPSDMTAVPFAHKLYATDGTSSQIAQIDEGGAIVNIPVSQADIRLTANPVTNKIYGWSSGTGTSPTNIDVVEGATLTASTIPVPTSITAMSINVATGKVYAASQSGPVYVIDGLTNKLLTSISLPSGSSSVAANPVTNKIYVVRSLSSSSSNVAIIDGATDTAESTSISLPYNPFDIAINPITNKLYATEGSSAGVIDLQTNTPTTLSVPAGTLGIGINRVTNKIYFPQSTGLAVIDGITNSVNAISVPGSSSRVSPVVNPVTNKIYTNSNNGQLLRVAEANTQDVLLDTTIAADTTDPLVIPQATGVLVTQNAQPSFLFTATSRFPSPVQPTTLFYQVDTWQGTWTQGTLTSSGSGTATFSGTSTPLLPGEHILYAYATDASPQTASTFDDANRIGNMGTFYFVVLGAPTTTTVVSDVNPQTSGSSVTFTATITPRQIIGSSGPTGTVSFYDGPTLLGTGTVSLVSGNYVATLATSSLTVGSHTITASYPGDGSYVGSDGTVTQKIVGPPTNITATGGGGQTTTYGTPFANPLVVTVADAGGTPVPGVTVIFSGSGLNFSSTTIASDANGVAQVNVTPTAAGALTASANVSGVSAPATFALTVTKAALTVTASDQQRVYGQVNPSLTYGVTGFLNGDTSSVITGTPTLSTAAVISSPVGNYPITVSVTGMSATNYTFTAVNGMLTVVKATPGQNGTASVTVSSSLNPSAFGNSVTFIARLPSDATGTATFYEGTSVVGTGTISNGSATVTTSTLATATHSITAQYSGDGHYNGATSAVLSQLVIKAAGSVTVNASPNPALTGQSVTVTATAAVGETGNVTFYDGTLALGTAPINNGIATLVVPTFTPGNHTITAQYSGDANYASATSIATTLVVASSVSDFAIANGTPAQIIPPGASASFSISITSMSAPFTNAVTLTATNLPRGAKYTFNPASVTPGPGGASSSFSVSVPAQSATLDHGSRNLFIMAALLTPFTVLRRLRGRPIRLLLWLAVSFAFLGPVIGCGAGGYFSQPQQTYVITVTGTSGSLVHSTTVSLTVE